MSFVDRIGSDKVGLRIAGFVEKGDGHGEYINTHAKGPWIDNFAVRVVMDFNPTDDLDIRFKGFYSKADSAPNWYSNTYPNPHYMTDWAVAAGIDPALLYNPGPESNYTKANVNLTSDEMKEPVKQYHFSLVANWNLGDLLLTSATGYVDLDVATIVDWDTTAITLWHESQNSDGRQFSQELRLTSEGESAFQWIIGGFFMDISYRQAYAVDFTDYMYVFGYEQAGTYGTIPTGYADENVRDQDFTTWAAFLHTTYAWTDKIVTTHAVRYTNDNMDTSIISNGFVFFPRATNLSYTDWSLHDDPYGLRNTQADDEIWEEVTWRVALEYSLRDDLLLYASISRGFRGGAMSFRGGQLNPQEPETNLAYEIGAKSSWLDNRLTLNGAVFLYDYENYQFYEFLPDDSTASGYGTQAASIPELSYKGFEIEIVARPVENLMVRLGYGYVDNEIEKYVSGAPVDFTGNQLPNIDDMDFNGYIRYDLFLGNLGVLSPQFEMHYLGMRQGDTANLATETGDYWTFNARLHYQDNDSGLGVSLYVTNISDDANLQRITFPDQSFGTDGMFTAHPREWGITISYEF